MCEVNRDGPKWKGAIECFRAFLCRTCERKSCLSDSGRSSSEKIIDSFLTISVFLLLQYVDLYVLLYTRCRKLCPPFAGVKTHLQTWMRGGSGCFRQRSSHTSNPTTGELARHHFYSLQKAVAAVTVIQFMRDDDNYPRSIIRFNYSSF